MNNIFKYGSIRAIPLYDCSALTPEEWSLKDGVRRPIAGIVDMAYGILINIVYTPIILVLLKRENIKMSCFKIMFSLGIVDMLALWVNSIITGFLAFQGAVYCTYPNLIYISGMTGLGLWCCSCIIAMSLVLNRLLDWTNEPLCRFLFEGYRTYLVLMLPIIYGLYFVFFTTPIVFSSKFLTWFFDPLIFENRTEDYTNLPHSFNNILVVAATCLLYVSLCCVLGERLRELNRQSSLRKMSTQIFLQSAIICAVNQIASVIYVIMNFIDVPVWLTMLGHVLWQFGHGAPVLIYLALNRTIRTGVLKMTRLKGLKSISTNREAVTSRVISQIS